MDKILSTLLSLIQTYLVPFIESWRAERIRKDEITRVEAANKAAAANRILTIDERLKDAETRGLYRD